MPSQLAFTRENSVSVRQFNCLTGKRWRIGQHIARRIIFLCRRRRLEGKVMQTAVIPKCKQDIATVRQASKLYFVRQKSVPLFLLVIALVLLSFRTPAQSPQPVEELAKR